MMKVYKKKSSVSVSLPNISASTFLSGENKVDFAFWKTEK